MHKIKNLEEKGKEIQEILERFNFKIQKSRGEVPLHDWGSDQVGGLIDEGLGQK
jgi:hypothetical protein